MPEVAPVGRRDRDPEALETSCKLVLRVAQAAKVPVESLLTGAIIDVNGRCPTCSATPGAPPGTRKWWEIAGFGKYVDAARCQA